MAESLIFGPSVEYTIIPQVKKQVLRSPISSNLPYSTSSRKIFFNIWRK